MTQLNEAALAGHAERMKRDGFTIVENAIEPELIDAVNVALLRLERELDAKPAMNGFEGHKTVRIYNLLKYGEPFTRIPVHANVLPVVERVLDQGCLISSLSSRSIWRTTLDRSRPTCPRGRRRAALAEGLDDGVPGAEVLLPLETLTQPPPHSPPRLV